MCPRNNGCEKIKVISGFQIEIDFYVGLVSISSLSKMPNQWLKSIIYKVRGLFSERDRVRERERGDWERERVSES